MDDLIRIVIVSALIVTAAASALAILGMYRRTMKEERELNSKKSAYTTADYHADVRCDICFDDIGEEEVSQCRCGKVFHLSCAEPTGECPYCGTPFRDFLPPRPARHITCPRCGNMMNGNICSCGTVLPDADGTFICGCGERLSVNDEVCHRCGMMFASRISTVKKPFIPNERWGHDGCQIQEGQAQIRCVHGRSLPHQGESGRQAQGILRRFRPQGHPVRRGVVHPQVHARQQGRYRLDDVEDRSGIEIAQDVWHIDHPEKALPPSHGDQTACAQTI